MRGISETVKLAIYVHGEGVGKLLVDLAVQVELLEEAGECGGRRGLRIHEGLY